MTFESHRHSGWMQANVFKCHENLIHQQESSGSKRSIRTTSLSEGSFRRCFHIDRVFRRDRSADSAENVGEAGFDGGREISGAEVALIGEPKQAAGEKGKARGHGELIYKAVAVRIWLDSHLFATIAAGD